MRFKVIDVCVTHFGDKYSTKYIDNLQLGIARNYSGDFDFIVKTDCPNGHWDKISFFECEKRTIIMDIDQIICSNLDPLFNYQFQHKHNSLLAFNRWWRATNTINGGFYIIEPSDENYILKETFYSDPDAWIKEYGKRVGTFGMGEQAFVYDHHPFIEYLPSKWIGIWVDGVDHMGMIQQQSSIDNIYEYKHDCKMLDNIKLLHFIYNQKIEQHEQWIQTLWNGTSYA